MENEKNFYKNFDESREISMRTVGAIGSIGTMVKVEKNHGNVEKVTGKRFGSLMSLQTFGSLMSFDENVEKK